MIRTYFSNSSKENSVSKRQWISHVIVSSLLLTSTWAFAHGGDDHTDPAPVTTVTQASRATLVGEYAEAVVVPHAGELVIWLDEADSNAPLNAELQLQVGNETIAVQREEEGLYHAPLAAPLSAGNHALVITLIAGEQTDLLTGELHIPDDEVAHEHSSWSIWWSLLLVPVLVLAFLVYGRRGRRSNMASLGTVALLNGGLLSGGLLSAGVLLSLLIAAPASAHGGEEHNDEPASTVPALNTVQGDAPKRLPDGSVFVPKSAQRLLNIRTEKVQVSEHAMSVRLNGQVIADPNGSGLIQASQAGRVLPVIKRLPALGSKVRAGDVLALLEPVLSQSERANLTGEQARAEAALAAAEKRLQRLSAIRDSVPRREYEQAEVELAGLRAQVKALGDSLHATLPLKAPISGIVSDIRVIAGAQIEAGATLMEIVSSDALVVEAAAFDDRYLRAVQSAVFIRDGQEYPLRFLGAGRKLRDQAIPVQFQVVIPASSSVRDLSIGSIGTVLVASAEQQRGASVPQSALLRGDDGRPQVLIKIAPEQFKLVTVESEPLPDNRALVRSGLGDHERVVISGASLLQQIR